MGVRGCECESELLCVFVSVKVNYWEREIEGKGKRVHGGMAASSFIGNKNSEAVVPARKIPSQSVASLSSLLT